MSTELESYFAALRDDVDTLPAAPPAAARHRGERRRRRHTVLVTATAFAAVAAVVIALGFGLPRGGPPADRVTTPPAPVETDPVPKFQPLTPVPTGIALSTAGTPVPGTTMTIGDRAFVCWQGPGGQATVAAIDLPTGATAWGPVKLAAFADFAAVYYHPGYVLVMGRNDNGAKPDGAIFALDPRTGRTLLHVDVDSFEADDVIIGVSTLVIASRTDGQTRGYDYATGEVRWTVPDPASRIVHSLPMQHGSGRPAAAGRASLGAVLATDQFVQLTEDGTAILRDLATGVEKARRPGADKPGTVGIMMATALDGILYTTDHTTLKTLRATSLTDSTPTTEIYKTPQRVGIGPPFVCGKARICFKESTEDPGYFVGFDTERRQVVWRQDGTADTVQVVDGRALLVLSGATAQDRSAVIDPSGRQLLKPSAQAGRVTWVTSQSALVFTAEPNSGQDRKVAGLSPLDGDPVPLGSIGTVTGCSSSRTHLICIAAAGIKVWRFAT
ncbi:PQQ-like beta-propeller repeat protein [Dactylosporangium matsuzakiense]|uniref:Pyrrolo-quinoline quinone repeat domain-containing protein n=1 Tax=Dactylosporangium matsuzakiense TaxID=53360 RepID=A0A9W6NRR7_9ACTN|nr:PQQ-like beta-propeller repeat protein [Dactylosporangium matsuzakiense]UWZ48585.1 PQQ-binding-like beta-propeller repeat protein [Dactylosporangium matsuzakiense]GLL06417.1 hypothetical protein GCM10017581_081670 [Dactylosporangium matsuzakiense]